MSNFFSPVFQPGHRLQRSLITCLIVFCLHINCYAADTVEKILINADHMQLNMETGVSVYTGNVKISQGKLVLSGDKVTLQTNKDNEIEHITVDGNPARYNHITQRGEPIEAESEHMVYNASQNKLVMTINARLQQPEHQLSSQKIIYDTLKKIIIAGGDSSLPDKAATETGTAAGTGDSTGGSQRVNITLTPKKQQPRENSAAE